MYGCLKTSNQERTLESRVTQTCHFESVVKEESGIENDVIAVDPLERSRYCSVFQSFGT